MGFHGSDHALPGWESFALTVFPRLCSWPVRPRCRQVHQAGTSGDDVLQGAPSAGDVLCGKRPQRPAHRQEGATIVLKGGDGDDELRGGIGDDVLSGAAGADAADFADSTAPMTVNLASAAAVGQGSDSLSGVESAIGSPQADTLIGDPGDNVLSGGDGNDTLAGGEGADTLAGDAGTDNASFGSAAHAVTVDLVGEHRDGPGLGLAVRGRERDRLPAGRHPRRRRGPPTRSTGAREPTPSSYAGASGPDERRPRDHPPTGQGADSLPGVENAIGSPQSDTLEGDSAANTLDGAGGNDTVTFAQAASGVSVHLGSHSASGDGSDTLQDFENAIGSPQNDVLAGDGSTNVLSGAGRHDFAAGGHR